MSQNKQYKVEWKFRTVVGSFRGDYVVENLEELLRLLSKSEGVNRASCKYIVIHEIHADGKVVEVYDYDTERANVVNIVEANLKKIEKKEKQETKPHMRLSHNPKETVRPFRVAAYGRYKAYEA